MCAIAGVTLGQKTEDSARAIMDEVNGQLHRCYAIKQIEHTVTSAYHWCEKTTTLRSCSMYLLHDYSINLYQNLFYFE